MSRISLTEGSVPRSLVRFAVPFMLASLLQVLYGAVDLFVVGRFADTAAVSAVSTGSQVMSMVTNIVLGVTTGTTVLMGQYFGARREKDLASTLGTSVVLFAALSAVTTVLMLLLNGAIVGAMQVPAVAEAGARDYVFICSAGVVFIVGYNVVAAVLRGLGDSRTPLYFVGIACAVNVVMDFALVAGCHMGAAGAAAATVLAQGISFAASLVYLKRRGVGFAFSMRDVRFWPDKAARTLRLGLPAALQNGLVSLSFLIITMIINRMGVVASASVGVVEKLIGLLMLPPSAFSAAVSAMTAQNVGAGRYPRAKRCMRWGIGLSLAAGAVACVWAQAAPQMLVSLFTDKQEVVIVASEYLRSYALDCLLVAFVFCMNGFLSGCGCAVFCMAHNLAATFALRIPLSFLFSRMSGDSLYPMGLAAPLASLGSILLCALYLRRLDRNPPGGAGDEQHTDGTGA